MLLSRLMARFNHSSQINANWNAFMPCSTYSPGQMPKLSRTLIHEIDWSRKDQERGTDASYGVRAGCCSPADLRNTLLFCVYTTAVIVDCILLCLSFAMHLCRTLALPTLVPAAEAFSLQHVCGAYVDGHGDRMAACSQKDI